MKSRGWLFTINNYTDDDLFEAHSLCEEGTYGIVGQEVGEQGTPHLQCYVYFQHARHFDAVKSKLSRAHLEKALGTPRQNQAYCAKDGLFVEYGKVPKKIGKEKISDTVMGMINDGCTEDDIRSEYPGFYLLHKKNIHSLIKPKEVQFEVIRCRESEVVNYLEDNESRCEDPDLYEGEDVLVIPDVYYKSNPWPKYSQWKIRRGYEIIHINPKKIILYKI